MIFIISKNMHKYRDIYTVMFEEYNEKQIANPITP